VITTYSSLFPKAVVAFGTQLYQRADSEETIGIDMQHICQAKAVEGQQGTELERAFPPDCYAALGNCFRRIGSWRVPPNWSVRGWLEEMKAHGLAAACQASCDYDPARGVLLAAFVYQRVLARTYSRYRQEWAYALRCIPEADPVAMDRSSTHDRASTIKEDSGYEEIYDALQWLPERARQLIVCLFWERRTEADIAEALGLSHQAISKRKRIALRELRVRIGASKKKKENFRAEVAKSVSRCISDQCRNKAMSKCEPPTNTSETRPGKGCDNSFLTPTEHQTQIHRTGSGVEGDPCQLRRSHL
jgi:RNA polymerase sigma factor (sigma-70 family)